jgi:aryl-alcohol dehydrogenase-like predicted oxidoreductase
MPYLPLAAGFLTGKVDVSGAAPAGTRLALDAGQSERWITESNMRLIAVLRDWAKARGRTLVELAFAWLLSDPVVGTVIAGASSPMQIAQNAAASSWRLSSDDRAEVTAILDAYPIADARSYYSVAGYFGEQVEVVKG